jgi:hypothetical protein
MPHYNYGSTIDADFPGHLWGWYELGLDRDYEQLEPRSRLGGMAVDLRRRMIEAALKAEDLDRRYESDTDRLVHEEELDAAAAASELADARHKVFEGMYFDMQGIHTAVLAGHMAPGDYPSVVADALARGHRELDRVAIPAGSREELELLNEEVAFFLERESDLHFAGMH